MEKKNRKFRNFTLLLCLFTAFAFLITSFIGAGETSNKDVATAANYGVSANGTYQFADNTGYKPSKAQSYSMSFGSSTFGNLKISGVESQGKYNNVPAYSIDGSETVNVKYTLKYNTSSINGSVWNMSSDSAKSVNGIELNGSSIGKGCVILEKKNLSEGSYTVLLREGNAFNSKNNYEITSLNGNDINRGCYYRLSVAYEIYRSYRVKRGWWIFSYWATEYEYKNCLEVYNFFVGRNSCNIQLLDLSEKDYSAYSTDEGQIDLIKKGDTLQNGSVTSKGFQINYLNNKSYTVSYSRNGGSYTNASDGTKITQNGKYDIKVVSLFGKQKNTTIYVYNGGADNGYATYFGSSIFDGKRVADLSAVLPTYQTGVKIHLNGVGGNIPLLRGNIKNETTGVVTKINASTNAQNIELNSEGVYFISLTNGDTSLAGTYYSYDFAFIVSNQSTAPSINKNNILDSYSMRDYDTKHIEVKYVMDSGKIAHICFDANDYYNAYQFAYAVEKKYVTEVSGGYKYNGVVYSDNTSLVEAMNNSVKSKLSYEYFTKALDNFYIDEESLTASVDLDELNYNKDVYVSTTLAVGKMLNRENIVDENFRFVQIGDYESKSITAKNLSTNEVTKLKYNTKLSSMLSKSGKYLITETNKYNESVTYQIVYCNTNETTITLNVNGTNVDVNRSNYQVVNGTNIKVLGIENSLDSDGVVVIANLSTKEVVLNNYEEFSSYEFSNASYLISVIDRSGNTFNFIVNNSSSRNTSLIEAINLVKSQNTQMYNYIAGVGVSTSSNAYGA